MHIISAAVPAPWWTPLSYVSETALAEGLRIAVPLGSSGRVALTLPDSCGSEESSRRLKKICSVIDETPTLPEDLWKLIRWFGDTWFIGTGLAAKTILPSKFFTDEKLPDTKAADNSPQPRQFSSESIYSTKLSERWDRYMEIAESESSALILFPESKSASAFWKALPKGLRDRGALWPVSPAARWKLWRAARSGDVSFIVGSPAAAFAPMHRLSAIVMDEENSGSWRTQSHPLYHPRPLLGMRASFAGARFVLGGSMPSSKSYMRIGQDRPEDKNDARLIFVSAKDSQAAEFKALSGTLPLSVPLIRESTEARNGGKWVFWLLDRKGYASEIVCDECGNTIRCARCGSAMRWEEKKKCLRCVLCGSSEKVPESCPNCGGRILTGSRPGLEALYERIRSALKYKFKNAMLVQDKEEKLPSGEQLKNEYPDGALIVGTRRILSLCDELSPALIGWIDADAEARGQGYDARARAFSMLWESMWRGASDNRKVVVQSRRPASGWQEGLRRGWQVFWKRELKERSELGLPPFTPLVRIKADNETVRKIAEARDAAESEYWVQDEGEAEVWVRTRRFDALRALLAPFFSITATKKSYPTVSLYLD